MASTIATTDVQAKVQVKTAHGTVSLPAHQAHAQQIPTIEVVKQYSATTTGTWSSYSEFSLTPDQLPHIVDTVTLALNLGAATKTGGTVISLVGDANWLFKSVEVYVGPNLISTLYAENGFIQELAHLTDEAKLKVLPAAGNAPVATRRTNTAAGQILYYNLPIPWLIRKTGWFAGQAAASLRFRLYHQDLTTIMQTDGSAPVCVINSVNLFIAGRNFASTASAGALVNLQRKLGSVSERFLDPIQQQVVLPSGSTSYTVQMTNFVGLFSHVWFVIRAQASVGTPLANAPDNFVSCVSYALSDSAGNTLIPTLPSAYALGGLVGRYTTGNFTDPAGTLGPTGTPRPVYLLNFSSDPEKALMEGSSHGFLKLDGLAKLTVNFASSLGAAYVVDFVGYVHSQLNSDASGAVTKVRPEFLNRQI